MADPNVRFEQIIDKLKAAGHKLTPQRLAISKILAVSEGHPSVEMIYEALQERFPTMSLATVYRNVMLIKSMGEVLELGFADGSNRYDGNRPRPHPHVVCVRCKKIVDPELESLGDMSEEVETETGFRILTHRLDFFGVCDDCRRSEQGFSD
jgi:Fur family peroxide stress response transcriptional regulator